MIIRGYLNRYKGGDVIITDDATACFIPLTGNKILTDELEHVEKLITYETINGINVRNVYINNHRTSNTPYIHIYSVLLPRKGSATALVNVHGVELFTGRHVVTLADKVYTRLCTHMTETNGDLDYIQLLALSNRDQSSDTEDYLTTLDDRSYDSFIHAVRSYMNNNTSIDLQQLYNDYIQRVGYLGYISEDEFLNLPNGIDDVMGNLDVIGESNELVDLLVKTAVNGIKVPEAYKKYDNKTCRLVENGYLTKDDLIHSFCVNCRSIKTDNYKPVLEFRKELLIYCYNLIETNKIEDERIYILSNCNALMNIIAMELLLQHHITDKKPNSVVVRRTIAEEVFIDVICDGNYVEYFFIDLTIVPLICHGLRYAVNEELD